MVTLFEIVELENFYNKLTVKELIAILEQGAVLGFSIEDRFAISFGDAQNRGNHEWLQRMKMMTVDISVVEVFYDEEGRLYSEAEPDAEDVLDVLLHSMGGVIDEIDSQFERLQIEL